MKRQLENKEKPSETDQEKQIKSVQKNVTNKNKFLSYDFYKFIDSEGTSPIYILGYN